METKNDRRPSLPNIFLEKLKIQWNYYTTWQGSSHFSPLHPGAQVQVPSRALQAPPLRHWQVRLQPSPHVPLGQFMEQSTPCQPAKKKGLKSEIFKSIQVFLHFSQGMLPSACHGVSLQDGQYWGNIHCRIYRQLRVCPGWNKGVQGHLVTSVHSTHLQMGANTQKRLMEDLKWK